MKNKSIVSIILWCVMKKDPIVEEVRKYRERHAKKFHYDLEKIIADFKQSELQRKTSMK